MLTELDHCILAVICRDGPVTAYSVRSIFQSSTTVSWSSSTGSIYPSIRRLSAAGLVDAAAPTDKRGTQALTITAAGREQLLRWLLPVSRTMASATPDPIRTRMHFLHTLSRADQSSFLEQAMEQTRAAIDELAPFIEAECGRADRLFFHLGDLGAMHELRARLAWLEEARALISAHQDETA